MVTRASLPLAALMTALTLAVAASSATAARSIELRTTEGGGRFSVEGSLMFTGNFELSPESMTICNVTLLMTLARVIGKFVGAQIGRVVGIQIDKGEARAPYCRGRGLEGITFLADRERAGRSTEDGRNRVLYDVTGGRSELWTITFEAYSGLLPEITGLHYRILGFQFQIMPFASTCLYRGEVAGRFLIGRRAVTGLEIRLDRSILPRDSGGGFCLNTYALTGSFTAPRGTTIALL